eukprot:14941506-Alexandrium_andersonii.AAC.1
MSASLVGSEMCIRDSPWLPARQEQRIAQICGLADCGLEFALARLRGLGPVSYTHLTLPTICSV